MTEPDRETALGHLADEFLDRLARGEDPPTEEYAAAHPQLAELIRDGFPLLRALRTPSAAGAAVPARSPPAKFGEFRILRQVGRGGMGVVYEAVQESLGRRVALKVLSAGLAAHPATVERFRREARTAAGLHHTNIVPVFAVGEQDGTPYYAMQFIDGRPLDRVLRNARTGDWTAALTAPAATEPDADPTHPPAPGPTANERTVVPLSTSGSAADHFRAVARIGAQAADALAYAHRQGILHRDVKPSNLLLDGQGTVWVADFGLAKGSASQDLTETGDVVGTLRYLAPERARGQADARSDVYALGATLYELATGRPAFAATDPVALLEQVKAGWKTAPRAVEPRVPRDLETIILRAMAAAPADRYPSAAALADDLRRFLAGTAILARPVPAWERVAKWARRRPAIAALLALSGVTAAGLLVTVVALWRNAEARAAAVQKLDQANSQLTERQNRLEVLEEGIRVQEARAAGMVGEIGRLEAAIPVQQAKLREARVNVRRALYIRDMQQAEIALQKENVQQLVQVLEKHRPPPGEEDVRGPEWHYLWRLCHGERRALRGHREHIGALCVSPDGTTVASRTPDTWKLWDTASGRELPVPWGNPDRLGGLTYSPDGNLVATAGKDGSIALWDAKTGRQLHTARSRPAEILTLAFAPDGKTLATCGTDGRITLLDVPDLQERANWPAQPGPFEHAEFTPDGRSLLTVGFETADGYKKIAHLWDVGGGAIRHTFRAHVGLLTRAAVSPDGRLLALGEAFTDGSFRTGYVRFWDPDTGKESGPPLTISGGGAWGLRFVPGGERLAVADNNGAVKLWDLATRKIVATYLGNFNRVHAIEFSREGRTMATGGNDTVVRLWDLQAPPSPVIWPGQPGRPGPEIGRGVFVSPNGQWLLACKVNDEKWIWDLESGRERRFRDPHVTKWNPITFSPDSRVIARHCKDALIRFQDVVTLQECREPIRTNIPNIRNIAYTPDGSELAAVDLDGNVGLWDLGTGKGKPTFRCAGHHSSYLEVFSLAFSPDGRFLATGGVDLTVRVWDRTTGAMVAWMKIPGGGVHSVAFSPDGKLLAAGFYAGSFMLWDTATFSSRHSLRVATALAGAGTVPGTAALTAPAVLAGSFQPEVFHSLDAGESAGHIFYVSFTPDGKTLIVAHGESGVKFWDVAMRQERFTLHCPFFVNSAALSACGRYLGGSGGEGTVHLWDIHSD